MGSRFRLVYLDAPTAQRLSELFGALSDPTRVRIIASLLGDQLSVRALADAIGSSESAVSHQLRCCDTCAGARP